MNEIILNGVSSSEIQGLIIQTLPPISKPLIRTQIDEIDGRDGDIVTPLGFSAYDKSFDIGLSYNYDIDDIIAYFNSEGTVIFSNEGGKYYNYQILEQIDFEKLIRFKTATVTMHVQPFKYSAVEVLKTFNTGLITLDNYSRVLNGITLNATTEIITVSGTPTEDTEFYIPINTLSLNEGEYVLNAYSSGLSPDSCSVRVIYNSPSDANSFGGGGITLSNDTTVTISSELSESETYNYIYLYISSGTAVNFTLDLSLVKIGNTDLVVRNTGNYFSKPTMTIYGSGTINFSLNGNQIFVINLGQEGYITIDSSQMEAHKNGVLKNRLVTGNYDNFILNQGKNDISFTGDVTRIEIEDYSRWI